MDYDYNWLYTTPAAQHWKKITTSRRAGVVAPLFSLYSRQSIGIGEFSDLSLLIDWCQKTGISIIQLLPLNDVGFTFTPYDAKSSFALEPMYLALEKLHAVPKEAFVKDIAALRKAFPSGTESVNYGIKKAKLKLLQDMFQSQTWENCAAFTSFLKQNEFWLNDYALFKIVKTLHEEKAWWEWPDELQRKAPEACQKLLKKYAVDIFFQKWLQWQLYEQLLSVKAYAQSKNVLLLGDLPLLVSKDSADVWAHQTYFKLNLASGAPPDMYFADGQTWGMPPYAWDVIAKHGYDYLIQKLKYAEHFFDMFRIDHFVGIFRLWTIPLNQSELKGVFDPQEEAVWEQHGKQLLDVMLSNTTMFPCAEDLGTVPDCSYKTIREYGIVGMDVQRWQRDWGNTNRFFADHEFRPNSIAAISTHDTCDLRGWWQYEVGTVEEAVFRQKCQNRGLDADRLIPQIFAQAKSADGRLRWKTELDSEDKFLAVLQRPRDQVRDFLSQYRETFSEREIFWRHVGLTGKAKEEFSREFAKKTLEKVNQTVSIFSIQLLQDWLSLSTLFADKDPREYRINRPGTLGDHNWSMIMPLALETLLELEINTSIREINRNTGRIK
ncbi:4-alpha-glucanotransferase [bacterium]|nr:4-alpha-glucanotransferase [bacterium]